MSEPSIDRDHAEKLANAAMAIKMDEEELAKAQADVRAAKKSLAISEGRLRKLADEITDKGLFGHGE